MFKAKVVGIGQRTSSNDAVQDKNNSPRCKEHECEGNDNQDPPNNSPKS